MRKLLVLGAVSGLLVSSLFAGTSSGHVKKIETRVTIDSSPSGNRFLVFGKLKPNKCALDQTVTVYEAGSGETLRLDELDGDGEYSVRVRVAPGTRVYAKVGSAVIVSNYQHSHKCRGDRSPTIHV